MKSVNVYLDKIKQINSDIKNIYCSIPFYLLLLWGVLSLLSLFFLNYRYVTNPFVLLTVFCKIIMFFFIFYFLDQFFIKGNRERSFYKKFQSFTGYGIIITYVFYSFPRIVVEFYAREENLAYIAGDFVVVLLITVLPSILYLFLRSDRTRLLLNVYTKLDLELEKKLKKDKALRKKEQKRLRSERNFFQNLWYDWIDVIIQAVLIVMLINQFLFQMYAIPSESMVPTFLKGDMVIVNKLIYGPQIPLTEWKLPSPIKPKTGDIVVYLNPKTYDKESDTRYKNVFARIFQPFLYRITFTKVDIDRKENGDPKERFIVKRMIAGEGEKVCILNNQVYKKRENTEWRKMQDLPNQKEYGETNLFYENTPGMDSEKMTKEIRRLLNQAEERIAIQNNDEDLTKILKEEKIKLLHLFTANNRQLFLENGKEFLERERMKFEEIKNNTFNPFIFLSERVYFRFSDEKIAENKKRLEYGLKNYPFVAFYRSIYELLKLADSSKDVDEMTKSITAEIKRDESDSPYLSYMKSVNAIYKIEMLRLFNQILTSKKISFEEIQKDNIEMLHLLLIYLDGFERVSDGQTLEHPDYYSFFELSNLPEYPSERDQYFIQGDHFLLGDNRYNSLDCRFETKKTEMRLDPDDKGELAKTINVTWSPHVIKDKFILGKAWITYFPLDRMKVLK